MAVTCSPDLFSRIKSCVGDWFRAEGQDLEFLYEALSDFEYTGFRSFHIPDLDESTFNDWAKFEDWCEDIQPEFMWSIVDADDPVFRAAYDESTPVAFFGSESALVSKVRDVLSGDYSENLLSVEIECSGESLRLIYFDDDAWVLGHGDQVFVVESLSYLCEENGFLALQ